ncbi:MAG TPA: AgmX/PglI C-terminal domain-containing protein [Candidatus Binatia bacterium]|nr:AgmX/PglI C-terminal domain-containing protein [Candidatus Binatia bacterium]
MMNRWMSALGLKGIIGIAGVVGLAIVYFGLGVGTESPKKEASARVNPAANQPLKPVRAMNLALGNMVFLAQELGFGAASAKGDGSDTNKIAARIEGQLQGVREIYRQESAKNSSLVGAVILQLNIAPSGEVAQVKELSSRLSDAEFKRAIFSEISKWSFAEIVSESLTVTCPLLFVHEGMDITTLVRWERSLGNFDDKSPRLAANNLSQPQAKSTGANIPVASVASNLSAEKTKPAAPAKAETKEFQIKYATLLRKDPNFSASSLTSLTIGTKVTVLGKQGDWLEVRANQNGPTGFIRKEFVTLVQVARK